MSKLNIKIGEVKDWKFGLITREVERLEDDVYVINDTSSGWIQAVTNKETIEKVVSGEIGLDKLNWK